MAVTFQVLEGIDKGRVYRDLPTPVDHRPRGGQPPAPQRRRVSRFHAKVQLDDDDFILTDLESTNGTRVNGTVVQIRRLRFGDRVGVAVAAAVRLQRGSPTGWPAESKAQPLGP